MERLEQYNFPCFSCKTRRVSDLVKHPKMIMSGFDARSTHLVILISFYLFFSALSMNVCHAEGPWHAWWAAPKAPGQEVWWQRTDRESEVCNPMKGTTMVWCGPHNVLVCDALPTGLVSFHAHCHGLSNPNTHLLPNQHRPLLGATSGHPYSAGPHLGSRGRGTFGSSLPTESPPRTSLHRT